MLEFKVSELKTVNPYNRQEPIDPLYSPIFQMWKKLLYSNTTLFTKIEASWGINQSNHFVASYIAVSYLQEKWSEEGP